MLHFASHNLLFFIFKVCFLEKFVLISCEFDNEHKREAGVSTLSKLLLLNNTILGKEPENRVKRQAANEMSLAYGIEQNALKCPITTDPRKLEYPSNLYSKGSRLYWLHYHINPVSPLYNSISVVVFGG